MRIGIDASRANTLHRTGTEWYSFFVIREMLALDTKNTYTLYVKEALVPDMQQLSEQAEIRILHWPPKFLWNQIRLSWEMLWHAPDLLFVPAHTVPLIHPRKLATTIHDVGFERFPELYAHTPIGPQKGIMKHIFSLCVRLFSLNKYRNNELDYHRFSVRLALRRAKKIFTVSAFSRQEISHFFHVSEQRVEVVPNGLHPDYRPYPKEEIRLIREKYRLPERYILFIGRWEKKKNISALLKGFAELYHRDPKQRLVLVGRPGTGFTEAWDALTTEVKQNIRLLENIFDDLPRIMAGAEVFLFPSAYEGFGLPVLEAMASDVPVVCAQAASLPEVAGDAAYYLDAIQPANIADALATVLGNKTLREDLKKRGKQRASEYNWKNTAKKILSSLQEM